MVLYPRHSLSVEQMYVCCLILASSDLGGDVCEVPVSVEPSQRTMTESRVHIPLLPRRASISTPPKPIFTVLGNRGVRTLHLDRLMVDHSLIVNGNHCQFPTSTLNIIAVPAPPPRAQTSLFGSQSNKSNIEYALKETHDRVPQGHGLDPAVCTVHPQPCETSVQSGNFR
jgi:hypothetical protein